MRGKAGSVVLTEPGATMSDLHYPFDQIEQRAHTAAQLGVHVAQTHAPESLDGVAAALATGDSGGAAAALAEWWTGRRASLAGGLEAYGLALADSARALEETDRRISRGYEDAAVPQ